MHNLETALAAREKAIVAIPCYPGTKIPAVKWKEWQTKMPPLELQREWFRQQCNIAIITTSMVVFDCETAEAAELVLEECGSTPHKLKTPRGVHLGYRKRMGVSVQNVVKIKGKPIDIRTDGGVEMIPHSETPHGRYEWLGPGLQAIADLPVAKIGWTRERTKKVMLPVTNAGATDRHSLLYRGQRYVDTFPCAVSGEGGHRTTFIASLKIAKFVNKDPQLAWQLLCYYSATKCEPSWDEKALRHKWSEGLKKAR